MVHFSIGRIIWNEGGNELGDYIKRNSYNSYNSVPGNSFAPAWMADGVYEGIVHD